VEKEEHTLPILDYPKVPPRYLYTSRYTLIQKETPTKGDQLDAANVSGKKALR
jgi:hypothetical protein